MDLFLVILVLVWSGLVKKKRRFTCLANPFEAKTAFPGLKKSKKINKNINIK